MNDPDKFVDLEPHQWRSADNRPKPKEPMFGPGAPWAAGLVVGAITMAFMPAGSEIWWRITVGLCGVAAGALAQVIIEAIFSSRGRRSE
jgi:CHASE1-domain containing sensor protein